MESKLLHEQSGRRTFTIVLKTGEEALSSLSEFVMPGLVRLVPGIHVLECKQIKRRGWPEQVRP
jgi:hypothetical protein